MALASLSAGFQSLPSLSTIKLGPSGADSWVGRPVHALGPCGSLQRTLLWGWEFLLLLPQPHGCFRSEVWGFISLCWNPGVRGLLCSPAVPLGVSMCECGAAGSAIHHFGGLVAAAWPAPFHNPPPHWSASPCLGASPLAPDAHLHSSYWSGWMFLVYLLGCRTSIQFDFLSVLVVFCF